MVSVEKHGTDKSPESHAKTNELEFHTSFCGDYLQLLEYMPFRKGVETGTLGKLLTAKKVYLER